eukprot:889647-Prymnesium_polylepis.1
MRRSCGCGCGHGYGCRGCCCGHGHHSRTAVAIAAHLAQTEPGATLADACASFSRFTYATTFSKSSSFSLLLSAS